MISFKDPVCGMLVPEGESLSVFYQDQQYCFCSELCQREFETDPDKYVTSVLPEGTPGVDISRRIAYISHRLWHEKEPGARKEHDGHEDEE